MQLTRRSAACGCGKSCHEPSSASRLSSRKFTAFFAGTRPASRSAAAKTLLIKTLAQAIHLKFNGFSSRPT